MLHLPRAHDFPNQMHGDLTPKAQKTVPHQFLQRHAKNLALHHGSNGQIEQSSPLFRL